MRVVVSVFVWCCCWCLVEWLGANGVCLLGVVVVVVVHLNINGRQQERTTQGIATINDTRNRGRNKIALPTATVFRLAAPRLHKHPRQRVPPIALSPPAFSLAECSATCSLVGAFFTVASFRTYTLT